MGLDWEIGKGHVSNSGTNAGFRMVPAVAGRSRAQVYLDAAGDLTGAATQRLLEPLRQAARARASVLPQRRDLDEKNAAAEAAYQKLLGLQVALDDVERRYADGQSWTGENATALIAGLQTERRQRLALRDAQKDILERCQREARNAREIFEAVAGAIIQQLIVEHRELTVKSRAAALEALTRQSGALIDEAVTEEHVVNMLLNPPLSLSSALMGAMASAELAPLPPAPPQAPPALKVVESPPIIRSVDSPPSAAAELPDAGTPASADSGGERAPSPRGKPARGGPRELAAHLPAVQDGALFAGNDL